MGPRPVLVLAAASVLALSGCGLDSDEGSSTTAAGGTAAGQADAAEAAKLFFDSAAAGNGASACAVLTTEERRRLDTAGGCQAIVTDFGRAVSDGGVRIGSVQADETRATAVIASDSVAGEPPAISLDMTPQGWLVSDTGLGGLPTGGG